MHGTYEARFIFYCYCKDCPQRISKNPFSNTSISYNVGIGKHCILEFDMDGSKVRLTAMAWVEPGPSKPEAPVKRFVETAGSSIPTTPIKRPRILVKPDGTCENTTRIIRPSAMIADYLNHYRQEGLVLELERTHDRVMHVFQTILGIMEVNAYLEVKSATKVNVIHKEYCKFSGC